MSQSTLYKIAIILFAILSLFNILAAVPPLLSGPENQGFATGIPQGVIILAALSGPAGLLAAYGAWRGEKWGIWLTIILCAGGVLSALPGVLFAPNTAARISAIVGVSVSIFVIVVLVRRPKPSISKG